MLNFRLEVDCFFYVIIDLKENVVILIIIVFGFYCVLFFR